MVAVAGSARTSRRQQCLHWFTIADLRVQPCHTCVCIPSFFVIYVISLFFDQFLSLRWVSCAFRGIQVCVIYLITAGLKMLKSIDKTH
ncbi:MAG: chromate transporter [Agathobacter rectalis]